MVDSPDIGRADLHIHSNYSDGTFSPKVIVEIAKNYGLRAISIADHDAVEGALEAEEEASRRGVELILGVELSSMMSGLDVHILGYFADIRNPKISDYLLAFRRSREERAIRIVEKLNDLGVNVELELVLEKAGQGSIGRPHIADAMVEAGAVSSIPEAFYRYIAYDGPAYVEKYYIDTEDAVALIRSAGGIPVLAHPGTYDKDGFLPELLETGIEGIEAIYPRHTEQQQADYREFARAHGLIVTGGSDCHGDRRADSLIGQCTVPYRFVEEMHRRFP